MKKITSILSMSILFLFACNSNKNTETTIVEDKPANHVENNDSNSKTNLDNSLEVPLGSWTGLFEAKEYKEESNFTWANKITIVIDSVDHNKVNGHSVVAGNLRPFEGSIEKNKNGFQASVKEPGDDKYDGTFDFIIEHDTILKGIWQSYNESLNVTERKYDLRKKDFSYNPNNEFNAYDFIDLGRYKKVVNQFEGEVYYDEEFATITEDAYEYNASKELLKEEDVANMKKGDLQIIRNTIYARHGYSFKNRIYRTIFDVSGVDWYMPVSVNVQNELTDIELKNIELLKRYEDYAEDYYDSFGR